MYPRGSSDKNQMSPRRDSAKPMKQEKAEQDMEWLKRN